MDKYTSEDVERIVSAIKRSKQNGTPFNLLTGAGCSRSAGIPLASELVEEIHSDYEEDCMAKLTKENKHHYSKCMSILSPDERRKLLRRHLDDAEINWGHIAIAAMMDAGFIECVLTFNFDSILMRACGICSLYPKTYDFATAPADNDNLVVPPAIIHLHGQGYGLAMMNSDEEAKEHAMSLKNFLRSTLDRHPIIVIGYSGESDAIFPVMTEVFRGEQRVYWLGHDDSPSNQVTKFLNKSKNQAAEYFGKVDSDRILVEIARRLGVFPPQLFKNPYDHLLKEIKPVQEYPFGDYGSGDILEKLRLGLEKQAEEQKNQPDIPGLMSEGKWEEVIKNRSYAELEHKELLAWAYVMSGNELGNVARAKQDERKFQQAFSKYAKAIEIKPDMQNAFYNWGNTLSNLAEMKRDEGLFREAFEKYAKATEIKSGMHDAYYNWGLALSNLTKIRQDEKLFREAFDKYAKAIEIKRDKHNAYYNWGVTLSDLAKIKHDEELFQEACDKYAKATEIKPDMDYAFNNWGIVLSHLAIMKKDEELFREAFDKYAKATEIKPDKHETFDNWGMALSYLAIMKKDEELLREAFDKYAKATEIKPDKHETFYNWGCSLSYLAEMRRDERLFREAVDKYTKATKIKPDMDEAFYNWGATILGLAKLKKNDALLKEANRVLSKAQELNPNVVYSLACVKARLKQYKECRELLEHAKSVGTLPPAKVISSESSFESVRDEAWFQTLLK